MGKDEKVLKYPLFLPVKIGNITRMVCVSGNLDADTVFQDGRGYVREGRIWVFASKPPSDSRYPYFWIRDHKVYFGKIRESLRDIFVVENLKSYDPITIAQATDPNESLYDEAALTAMNIATSSRMPEVKEHDDFLKKMIKHAIIQKNINLNRLKPKLDKSYSFSNLITALENDTKMSVPVFNTWCNLLGLKFELTVFDDNTDPINPLKSSITYSSEWDRYMTDDNKILSQRSKFDLDDESEED